MFERETEMVSAAAGWMRRSGLVVRSEFVTPWGICDLVGLRFNKENVARRLRLRQRKPISSIARAVLLLQIPDIETHKSIALKTLARRFAAILSEEVVAAEAERLIADRFVTWSSRGKLQRLNGWMPLHHSLVAIELKLSRIDEAMRQARKNLGFADQSYVGFPPDVARRIVSDSSRWQEFFDAGVGLLQVTRRQCKTLIPAGKENNRVEQAIQFCCVEKFWRSRCATGNST